MSDSKAGETRWGTAVVAVLFGAYLYFLAGPGLRWIASELGQWPSGSADWLFYPFALLTVFALVLLPTWSLALAISEALWKEYGVATTRDKRPRSVRATILVLSLVGAALPLYLGYRKEADFKSRQKTLIYVLLPGEERATRATASWYWDHESVIVDSLTFLNNHKADIEECHVREELTGYCESESGRIRLLGTEEVR